MISIGILKKGIYEAEKSDMRFEVGAVIFNGAKIFGSGHNYTGKSKKIHPKYRNKKPAVHAEQSAILKVKDWKKLSGASILVIRLTNVDNMLSMAYPCQMCMNMIQFVGIKNIYYSISL